MDKFTFCGIDIDNLTMADVVKRFEQGIATRTKGYVLTPNVAHIVRQLKNSEFRSCCMKASLHLADSKPLLWVSALFGMKLRERITGTDLVHKSCELSVLKGYRIYLLGARDDVIQKSKQFLQTKYPGVKIVGAHNGYFKENGEIIREINSVHPDILFVGMGFGHQEQWLCENLSTLDICWGICVGGVFDVFSGKIKRAPLWIQNAGCEWLWRLVHEPRRLWKRYLLGNTIFVSLVIKEFIKQKMLRQK